MAKKRKRSATKLVPELMLDPRQLENIVFACAGAKCRCRIELTPDDKLPEGAVCPCCGRSLAEERELFKLYCDAYEALFCPRVMSASGSLPAAASGCATTAGDDPNGAPGAPVRMGGAGFDPRPFRLCGQSAPP